MNKRDIDDLLQSPGSNDPVAGSEGAGGRRQITRLTEQQRQTQLMAVSDLLAAGYTRDRIIEMMGRETLIDAQTGNVKAWYGLRPEQVNSLIKEVRAIWDEESEDVKRYAKDAAIRRLLREIEEARRQNSYTAVANLEKVLMEIQGTAKPIEIQPMGDTRVTEAILKLLGELDPVRVRVLIEQERSLILQQGEISRPALPHAEVDAAKFRREKWEKK